MHTCGAEVGWASVAKITSGAGAASVIGNDCSSSIRKTTRILNKWWTKANFLHSSYVRKIGFACGKYCCCGAGGKYCCCCAAGGKYCCGWTKREETERFSMISIAAGLKLQLIRIYLCWNWFNWCWGSSWRFFNCSRVDNHWFWILC